MKPWPVPESYSKNVPAHGSPGAFWEDRGDRRHCGIDIYAPAGSAVLAVEGGRVIGIGTFTSAEKVPYWNNTKYVLVENKSGHICRYAELEESKAKIGGAIKAGQTIGSVGNVLEPGKITRNSPTYVQKLSGKENFSMLHFELHSRKPPESGDYLGGNWFGERMPKNLLDPYRYLFSTL